MTDKSEHLFNGLVRRAIVPKGFRPESDEDIEQMLDELGPVEVSDESTRRMLDKINGVTPFSWEEEDHAVFPFERADSLEARELAELYSSQGESLPPELEEKLREMEQRAAEPPDEDSNDEAD